MTKVAIKTESSWLQDDHHIGIRILASWGHLRPKRVWVNHKHYNYLYFLLRLPVILQSYIVSVNPCYEIFREIFQSKGIIFQSCTVCERKRCNFLITHSLWIWQTLELQKNGLFFLAPNLNAIQCGLSGVILKSFINVWPDPWDELPPLDPSTVLATNTPAAN